MFLSSVNRNYAFYYKIHSADDSENCLTNKLYCWSFYVKILGSRMVTVFSTSETKCKKKCHIRKEQSRNMPPFSKMTKS